MTLKSTKGFYCVMFLIEIDNFFHVLLVYDKIWRLQNHTLYSLVKLFVGCTTDPCSYICWGCTTTSSYCLPDENMTEILCLRFIMVKPQSELSFIAMLQELYFSDRHKDIVESKILIHSLTTYCNPFYQILIINIY